MVNQDTLADMMAVIGAALVAIAAGMVFVPAGIAVAGVACIAGAVALAREGGR